MFKHFQKYTIGIRKKNQKFTFLKPPFYEFWADPFIIEENKRVFLFFEVFNYFGDKGHISYAEYNINENRISKPKILLKVKYHLSYPQIIRYNNKFFMIPESYQNETISLYEFTQFPSKLQLKKDLFENFVSVDSTMFIKNKDFFLFTNPRFKDREGTDEILHIYRSENIDGPYKLIENMEIQKKDKSNLRMAGNILTINNTFFRLSQNCENVYGEHMNLNEIIKICENEYIEKYCGKLELDISKFHHTYNQTENYEVIDIVKYISLSFVLFTLCYRFPILLFKKVFRNKGKNK